MSAQHRQSLTTGHPPSLWSGLSLSSRSSGGHAGRCPSATETTGTVAWLAPGP